MPKFCTNCGKPMEFENAHVCPRCGVRIGPPPGATAQNRSALIAVFLSFFFVGWGHWYNGRRSRGLMIFGAFLIPLLLTGALLIPMQDLTESANYAGILVFISAGIWIFGMYDACRDARKINRGELGFVRKSRLFWFPVILIPLAVILVIAFAAYVVVLQLPSSYSTAPDYYPGPPPPPTVPTQYPVTYRPTPFPTPVPTVIPYTPVYATPVPIVTYRPINPAPVPPVNPYRPRF